MHINSCHPISLAKLDDTGMHHENLRCMERKDTMILILWLMSWYYGTLPGWASIASLIPAH